MKLIHVVKIVSEPRKYTFSNKKHPETPFCLHSFRVLHLIIIFLGSNEPAPASEIYSPLSVSWQAFMEDVKSRGPFIYSVLESAQAFLAQHPFQEPEETLTDGKGLLPPTLCQLLR